MPESIRASVLALGAVKQIVLGGPSVVSDAAASNLGCLVGATPTIAGTVQVGKTLTVRTGTWTSGTTLSIQWYANGAAISGATGTTLALTTAHQGKKIMVRVTGSKPGYVSMTKPSTQTAAVAKAPAAPKPPTKPGNPGDTKNCSDFSTWRQAQDWFEKYCPHYGDVAKLDGDNDGIACESLPGAP